MLGFSKCERGEHANGAVPSPFDCYQVNRSLKTLAIRMKQHGKSAFRIAEFLSNHPAVEKIFHPGLPSHPHHKLALKQSYGHSGMISFYVKGGYTSASHIRPHKLTHTGNKLFSCDDCGTKFSHRKGLLQHKKMHMEQRIFFCNICKIKYDREEYLGRHMKEKHQDVMCSETPLTKL